MTAKILVVDDSEVMLKVARIALEGVGYTVITSSNPLEVASLLRHQEPDLVLIDVEMPVVHGSEVVSTIRRFQQGAGAPMVLFSGLPDDKLETLCSSVGADGWIRKSSPFKASSLVREVRSFLSGRPAKKPKRSCRALVVDDSKAMRKLIKKILESEGLTITTAEDGVVALELLQHGSEVDLMVADLHMPRMNGLRLIEAVRAEGRFKQLPIVVVSSDKTHQSVSDALQAGANDYVFKPFAQDSLITKIRCVT